MFFRAKRSSFGLFQKRATLPTSKSAERRFEKKYIKLELHCLSTKLNGRHRIVSHEKETLRGKKCHWNDILFKLLEVFKSHFGENAIQRQIAGVNERERSQILNLIN